MSLTLSDTVPLSDTPRIDLDGQSPRAVVDELATEPAFVDALVDAVLAAKVELPPTAHHRHLRHVLREAGVDALDGAFAAVAAEAGATDVCRRRAVPRTLVETTRAFGDETPGPLGFHQPLDEWADGPAALLGAVDVDLEITVVVHSEFRDQRRDQREAILADVLAPLAAVGVDVRVVASGLTQRWLADDHRGDLPGVREQCSAEGDRPAPDAVASEAASTLSHGDRAVRVLEVIAEQSTETVDYDLLDSRFAVSRSTIRNVVGTLVDLDLVSTFGSRRYPQFELTAGGRQFVEEEIAVQQRLTECVRNSGNSSGDSRVFTRAHGRGEEPGSGAVGTAWLDRATTAAALGVAGDGDVTLVDHPVERWDYGDRGWPEPHLAVLPARDEAVAAVEAVSPLQTLTSTALALVGPKARGRLWTDARLSELDDLLDGDEAVLRAVRTVGWVSEDTDTATEWLDEIADAAVNLRDQTRDLGTGNYEDRNQLRGEIMRMAHGLVGVAAQVADLCGIDLTWHVRIPEFTRNWDDSRRAEMARTLAQSLVIQSAYSGHTAWRQLLEPREDKREQSFSVDVDAADPHARLLTELVVVGDGVPTFASDLEAALDALDEQEHEDAPDFAAAIPVRTMLSEADWQQTLRRACRPKRLQPQIEAVRTARALVGSPFDLSEAVTRGLSPEDSQRELRADELRTALQTLPSDRIVPDQPPTVSKIVATLLRVDGRVDEATLAEAADVSRRAIRMHRESLASLGLLHVREDGMRLRLAARRRDAVDWPLPVRYEFTPTTALFCAAQYQFDHEIVSDPEHPIMSRLYSSDTPVLDRLADDWPWLRRWCGVLRALVGRDPPPDDRDVRVGSVEQTALRDSSSTEAAG